MEAMSITRSAGFPVTALCRRFCKRRQLHLAGVGFLRIPPLASRPLAQARVSAGGGAPANPHADYPMEQSDD